MANVSFGKGTVTPTGTTSSFTDGMIYFNTSTKKIHLNNGGTVVTFDGNNTNTDTKVTNTLGTTTKFYLTGTSSSTTNTGTQYFDTNIYSGTTAGYLHATRFNGSGAGLSGIPGKTGISDTYVAINKTFASIWGHDKTKNYSQFIDTYDSVSDGYVDGGLHVLLDAMPGGSNYEGTTSFSYGHNKMKRIWVSVDISDLAVAATTNGSNRVVPFGQDLSNAVHYNEQDGTRKDGVLVECVYCPAIEAFHGTASFGSNGGPSGSTSGVQVGSVGLTLFPGGSNGLLLHTSCIMSSGTSFSSGRTMGWQTCPSSKQEYIDSYQYNYTKPTFSDANYMAEDYVYVLGYSCI